MMPFEAQGSASFQPYFYGDPSFRPAAFGDLRFGDVANHVLSFLRLKDTLALRQVCRGWRLCALTAVHYGDTTSAVTHDKVTGMWQVALRPPKHVSPFPLGLWPRRILELTLVDNDHTAAWMKAIQHCTPAGSERLEPDLLRLQVRTTAITEITAILPHIAKLTQLQHLNLSCNGIGAAGAAQLGAHLEKLTQLQRLSLSGNNIGAAGAVQLGPHLANLAYLQRLDRPQLQHLNLSKNIIDAAGAAELGPHLAKLTHLQHLNLSENFIGADGAVQLGPHLAKLAHLQHLDLSHNVIRTDGAVQIGPHLAILTQLQHLDLSHNRICDAGALRLGPQLEKLTQLQHLDLSSSGYAECVFTLLLRRNSARTSRI